MGFFNSDRSIFTELKDTNPQQLITINKELENSFVSYLSIVQQISNVAQQLLNEFFAENQAAFPDDSPATPDFPIPVREIAKRCNFLIFETEMADTDSMEQDEYGGGRTTIAQVQMRERKRYANDNRPMSSEIVGTIVIDKNLSEYDKRFAIAHELGHYVLRTLNPIGPLFIEDSCPGPFAYIPVKEFLANEFAYALLLPYSLVKERKRRYEIENQYNPLNYMDWIQVLENEAQLPQYCVILAYEEIKKCQLVETREIRTQMTDIKMRQQKLLDKNETLKNRLNEMISCKQRLLDENEELKKKLSEAVTSKSAFSPAPQDAGPIDEESRKESSEFPSSHDIT